MTCVLVCTETGEAFTWGWKECIPSKDPVGKQQSGSSEQGEIGWSNFGFSAVVLFIVDGCGMFSIVIVSQPSQGSNAASGTTLQNENRKVGEESVKRRRVSTAKDETEGHTSGGDFFATTPSLVSVGLGVRITSVATGGRHTLALSGEVE